VRTIIMDASDHSEKAGSDALHQMNGFDFTLPIRSVPRTLPTEKTPPHGDIKSENFEKNRKRFSTTLIKKYNIRRLGSTVWPCNKCKRNATDLIHASGTTLPALGTFGSSTSDALIPVCQKEACIVQANSMAESFVETGFDNPNPSTPGTTSCQNCGNQSRMKLCAGCRFTCKYCVESSWEWNSNLKCRPLT
jgi:hypothetical protein